MPWRWAPSRGGRCRGAGAAPPPKGKSPGAPHKPPPTPVVDDGLESEDGEDEILPGGQIESAKHVKSAVDANIPLNPDAYKSPRVAVWILNDQNQEL